MEYKELQIPPEDVVGRDCWRLLQNLVSQKIAHICNSVDAEEERHQLIQSVHDEVQDVLNGRKCTALPLENAQKVRAKKDATFEEKFNATLYLLGSVLRSRFRKGKDKRKEASEDIEDLKEKTIALFSKLHKISFSQEDPKAHLYGFSTQLDNPITRKQLLQRAFELFHPEKEAPDISHLGNVQKFTELVEEITDQELMSDLYLVIEKVFNEGVMSHFDFENIDHKKVFLFSDLSSVRIDSSQSLCNEMEKAALSFQLTSKEMLKKQRKNSIDAILQKCRSMGKNTQSLADLPAFGHAGGLKTFLQKMGSIDGSIRFKRNPHQIDLLTANLAVLRHALESDIFELNEKKTVLTLKNGEFLIFYERDKEYADQENESDIPKKEDKDGAKRLIPFV